MSSAVRPSKNERRDAAREKAREERLRQQRREKRNKLVLQLSIGLVLVAIVAIVALIIVNSVRPPGPGPRNMASGGITIGQGLTAVKTPATAAGEEPAAVTAPEGKVLIQAWEDFGCPACRAFETTNGQQIQDLVESGAAVVQYFPVAILDRAFTDGDYSTRAANAGAAVANYSPDDYFRFQQLMYENQPAESGPGLEDDRLVEIAREAGAGSMDEIEQAIRDQSFAAWVGERTEAFADSTGPLKTVEFPAERTSATTPTVVVNGEYFAGDITDADAFSSFVTSIGGSVGASPSPTPSPSATE